MMNGITRTRTLAALLLLAMAGWVAACRESSANESEEAFETVPVTQGDLDIRVEAAGIVEPILVVEVKSKASGEILALHVDTGDRIARGTLMAEVDPRDVRNALAQAQADLEVAQARVAVAEAQQRRAQQLLEGKVVTEQEYESATLEAANARAQLVKAQTNLELAQERMGDVTIRAPIDGTVIEKSVEAGQIIQSASQNVSGGTTLFRMADLSEMQVRTLVDETDIGKVEANQVARVTVEAYTGRTFTGHVLKIEPQAVVEQNVTMFPVLVRLDNREGLLRPNMNAEVQIEVASRQNVLLVQNAAIVSPSDAMAAAAVVGLDADAVRGQLRGAFAGMRPGGNGQQAPAAPASDDGARRPATADRTGQQPAAQGSAAQAAGPDQATCRALFARLRDQGRDALNDADRATLQQCRQAMGGQRPGAAAAAEGSGSPADNIETRRGFVFVMGPDGPEARSVTLGLNDWDRTEIVSGVEVGERVILMSVARLRQQQEDMMNRIRERSGPLPGGRR